MLHRLRRRLAGILAAIALLTAGLVATSAPAAHAVQQCNTTRTLGNPKLVNIGPRQNTVRSGAFTIRYVNIGSPIYFCPVDIYVHAGYDIRVLCSNGVVFWRRAWGWMSLEDYCAYPASGTIRFNEYKQ